MSTPAQKPRPSAAMMMTLTSSFPPSASISAAIAAQPALSKAFTGGWSNTSSAMPSLIVVLNGLLIAILLH